MLKYLDRQLLEHLLELHLFKLTKSIPQIEFTNGDTISIKNTLNERSI